MTTGTGWAGHGACKAGHGGHIAYHLGVAALSLPPPARRHAAARMARARWRAAPALQPTQRPQLPGAACSLQQPCRAGRSGTVPFTAKPTITGIPRSVPQQSTPKRGRGRYKKKKAGLFHSSLPPLNPAFNQKNKAWYFVCRLGKHKSNFNNPSEFT